MAKATASAKPGNKNTAAQKPEKVERQHHPSLKVDKDGKATVKLDKIPEDFDKKLHKPLRRLDFADETVFMLMRADELEEKAKRIRNEAEQIKKLGSTKERAKAKKLLQMQKRMAELQEQLKKDGVDVDALLSTDDSDEE